MNEEEWHAPGFPRLHLVVDRLAFILGVAFKALLMHPTGGTSIRAASVVELAFVHETYPTSRALWWRADSGVEPYYLSGRIARAQAAAFVGDWLWLLLLFRFLSHQIPRP